MNYVVLLAGGSGSRMGQDIPKQFIHVENKPVIVYTLEVLQAHAEIDGIVCVCVDGWEKILAGYAKQFSIDKLHSSWRQYKICFHQGRDEGSGHGGG